MAVSICLPVYNGERFLAQAIESVLAQSFTDFELIIIDDVSTDSSYEIAQSFADKDKRIRLLRNEVNVGLFQNYNLCLEKSGGKYIKTFAQDDVLDSTMLTQMIAVFENNPDVALVSTAKRWLSATGECLRELRPFAGSRAISGRDVILYNLIQLTNWVGEPSAVMFRAERRGTGFDTNLFHYGDIDYWFRILEDANFYYLDKVLCGFRRHAESATSRNLTGMYFALDIMRMGEKYFAYLDEIGESRQHFLKRALEVIALNVDHLVRNEGCDAEQCLAARPARMPVDEAAAFKELTFESVRYITELLSKISALEHQLIDQAQSYEAQLEQMRQSTSWRITAPLRNLSALKGGI